MARTVAIPPPGATGDPAPALTRRTPTAAPLDPDPYARATVVLAQALVVLIGLEVRVALGVTLTLVAAMFLAPLWLGSLRRYPLAIPLLTLVAVAIPMGFALAEASSVDHVVSTRLQVVSVTALLSGVAAFVLLLWARQLLPLHRIVILYAAGALASDVLASRLSWKFDLQLPVTLLALALIERHGIHRRASVVVVMAFGVAGLTDDSRSFVGLCAVAAALTIWQLRPRSSEPNRWYPAALMVGISVAAFLLAQSLLVGGYLGAEVQERSMVQVGTTGSVIAGGRPEWAATRELVKHTPAGYGVGVVPNWDDLQTGKAGLKSINVELESNRKRYMFDGQLRLHSITADLWAGYGWAGLALAVGICVALIRSLSFSLAACRAPTSIVLLAFVSLWFTLFGPLDGNWLDVCVALGLVLVAGRGRPLEAGTTMGPAPA